MKLESTPDVWVVAPATGVGVASFVGVPIQSWVLWLNLIYIILAIGWKLWSIYKESKNGRK